MKRLVSNFLFFSLFIIIIIFPLIGSDILAKGIKDVTEEKLVKKKESQQNESITCAIIIPLHDSLFSDSPLISLLELELLQYGQIDLLERIEINTLLQEQQLAQAFKAKAVRDRIQLGKILKADLLFLIRTYRQNDMDVADLVISETKGGVRLHYGEVILTENIKQSVQGFVKHFNQGLKKYREGIKIVAAVPPFLSNDLTHRYDYLQQSYARIIEQLLLQQEGIVVVELEEARSISEELTVSSHVEGIKRELPFYVLGNFRNEGIGDNRNISISLTIKRGNEEVLTIKDEYVKPGNVNSFLLNRIYQWLFKLNLDNPQKVDPIVEAQILADRSRLFNQLGEWEEAIYLGEASLLITPQQTELHFELLPIYKRFLRDFERVGKDRDNPKFAEIYLTYALHGLQHFYYYIHYEYVDSKAHNWMNEYWPGCTLYNAPWDKYPDYLKELQREINFEQIEIIHYILKNNRLPLRYDSHDLFKIAQGNALNSIGYFTRVFTVKERLDAIKEMLILFGEYDNGKYSFRSQAELIADTFKYSKSHKQIYEAFLSNLDQIHAGKAYLFSRFARTVTDITSKEDIDCADKILTEITKEASSGRIMKEFEKKTLREYLDKWVISNRINTESVKKTTNGGSVKESEKSALYKYLEKAAIEYEKSKLRTRPSTEDGRILFSDIFIKDEQGRPIHIKDCHGWLQCGSDFDIIYGCFRPNFLFVMKRKGVMTLIPGPQGKEWSNICDVKYDGRYIWIAIHSEKGHIYLVDDKSLNIIADFNEQDGLPPTTYGCMIAPLKEGLSCVAGSLGRAWIASLSYNPHAISPEKRKTVNIFHEAKQEPPTDNPFWPPAGQYDILDISYRPVFAIPFQPESSDHKLVFVGCYYSKDACYSPGSSSGFNRVLIVDPTECSVSMMPISSFFGSEQALIGEKLYFTNTRRGKGGGTAVVLNFAQPPDFRKQEVLEFGNFDGFIGFQSMWYDGKSIHLINNYWTTIDISNNQVHCSKLDTHISGGGRVAESNFYDMVYYDRKGSWQVQFAESE